MSESQKPVGYGHDNKGAAGGATIGGGKPGVAHTVRPTSPPARARAPRRRPSSSTARRSTSAPARPSSAPARRHDIKLPHLCYSPKPGYRAGRQLPRLHGRDRGRARAGGKLHPHADARHEGQDPDRPRQDRAPDGLRAADDRPAGRSRTRTIRTREFWKIAKRQKIEPGRFPKRERIEVPRAGPQPRRRWRSISTPASSAISASAPAARCRSTTSSAWPAAAISKRSCSTSTTRWAPRPASPAANACRPARPAR